MEIKYVTSQSKQKPSLIDKTSSPSGVYIRRDIKEVITEDIERGNSTKYFVYQEAFLTLNEYELYSKELIVQAINGDENSQAFSNYQDKLNTPVEYTNGFTYKPKWANSIYVDLIQKGMVFPQLFPLKIYDSTEKEERAQSMTIEELTKLAIFLAQKQEQFFKEYKEEKTNIN